MSNEMQQFVLLKDGTLLPCTVKQRESISMAILMAKDINTQKIKLNGRVFKLLDMESDPNKIATARQQGLPLDVETAKYKNTDVG